MIDERERRANTLRYLESEGLAEGRDWYWGTTADWGMGVVDQGDTLAVDERIAPASPADADALPIMIRASGVRLLGGPKLAAAMDDGRFPVAMPFVVAPLPTRPSANYRALARRRRDQADTTTEGNEP